MMVHQVVLRVSTLSGIQSVALTSHKWNLVQSWGTYGLIQLNELNTTAVQVPRYVRVIHNLSFPFYFFLLAWKKSITQLALHGFSALGGCSLCIGVSRFWWKRPGIKPGWLSSIRECPTPLLVESQGIKPSWLSRNVAV